MSIRKNDIGGFLTDHIDSADDKVSREGVNWNTEASTTRRPLVPCTRKSLLRTPPRFFWADRTGARGVMAPGIVTNEIAKLLVGLKVIAGQVFLGDVAASHQLPS